MAKKKKNAKELRKEQKKERLSKLVEKKEKPIIVSDEVTVEELKENAKILDKKPEIKRDSFAEEERFFRKEKNDLQKELDMIKSPEILEMPDFLIDPNMEDDRRENFEKIKHLLKRRFSLVAIADILETNRYTKLDEVIERKENMFKLVEKYTSEEAEETVRLFSGFRKVVGDEYSKLYSEQEERVRAAINILCDGKYFKNGMSQDKLEEKIEDIISSVIDNTDFNLACQIETEFIDFELNRAITILSDLRSRVELRDLIEELLTVSVDVERRTHAYQVMDMLISGKRSPRKIINQNDDEKGDR